MTRPDVGDLEGYLGRGVSLEGHCARWYQRLIQCQLAEVLSFFFIFSPVLGTG